MSFDEFIENLVFSATYPLSRLIDGPGVHLHVPAHEQAREALRDRYGTVGLQSLVSFMRFRVLSDKVRRATEAAAADVLTASWAAS